MYSAVFAFQLWGMFAFATPNLGTSVEAASKTVAPISSAQRFGNLLGAGLLALCVASTALLLSCFPRTKHSLLEVVPLAFSFSAVGLLASCSTCTITKTLIPAFTPIVLAIMAIVTAFFYYNQAVYQLRITLVALSCTVLGVQAYLLVKAPHFCLYCMVAGIATLILLINAAELGSTQSYSSHAGHRAFHWFCAVLGIVILSSASLQAIGIGGRTAFVERPRNIPNLTGKPITDYLRSWVPADGDIILVSKDFCEACKMAKSILGQENVKYYQVPGCTFINKSDCFSASQFDYGAPLFLKVAPGGKISYFQEGLPSSQKGILILISSLREEGNQ